VEPSTVQTFGTFQFYASNGVDLGQGSSLWLYIPSTLSSLQTSLAQSCTFIEPTGGQATCSHSAQSDGRILFKVSNVQFALNAGENIQFEIENFMNPLSTKESDSLQVDVYDANNVLVGS